MGQVIRMDYFKFFGDDMQLCSFYYRNASLQRQHDIDLV